jgi:hypothetical protein
MLGNFKYMIETKPNLNIKDLVTDEPIKARTEIQAMLEGMNPNCWADLQDHINNLERKKPINNKPEDILNSVGSYLQALWRAKVIAPKDQVKLSINDKLWERVEDAFVLIPEVENGWVDYADIPAHAKLLFQGKSNEIRLGPNVYKDIEDAIDGFPDNGLIDIDTDLLTSVAILFPEKRYELMQNPKVLELNSNLKENRTIFRSMRADYLLNNRLFFPRLFKEEGGVTDEDWKFFRRTIKQGNGILDNYMSIKEIYTLSLLTAPVVRLTDWGFDIQQNKPLVTPSPSMPKLRRF